MNKKMMLLFSLFILSFVFISGTVYAFSFGDVYSVLFGSVLSVFDTSDTVPVINVAYLDKQKYMPGEQMIVTASVFDAEYVKAYIETDVGVDEVDMVLVTGTKKDGTWQVAWTLHDTVTKEYFTKIVAVSKDYIEDEKVLIWFDPIVSHSWAELTGVPFSTASGNIGIGTNNPSAKLDVNGSGSFDGRLQIGNTQTNWINDVIIGFNEHMFLNDGALFVGGYTGTESSDLRLYITDNVGDKFSIWGDSCGGGDCLDLNAASLAHEFTAGGNVYHKGNVGIGTTTPGSAKLNVSGNISITGPGNGVIFPDGSVQTTAVSSNGGWPAGSYCILRAGGSCPVGFNGGSIYLDTEDNNNADNMAGSHGDSTMSGTGVAIYFCCK